MVGLDLYQTQNRIQDKVIWIWLVFCCVGALSILDALHLIDTEKLGWWLCERQLPNGGLNGRPEKLEDVCYSWWVLSSLQMVGKLDHIDKEKLAAFILQCQDEEIGGFSDRPGNMTDLFHTLFGICGLSLLGYFDLMRVDVRYCMPIFNSWLNTHDARATSSWISKPKN